jgi:hypothetical protein
MTERSQHTRTLISICLLGLNTGCLSSQDLAVSEPNDLPDEPAALSQGAVTSQDIALASDVTWDVYSSRSLKQKAYLGKAQLVCSNAKTPAGCPEGAVDYGFGDGAWSARIDACEGKPRWIWAPGITGASAPSEWEEYYFVNHVSVPGRPKSALVHVAVDDLAEVIINGAAIGTVGSTTDFGVAWAGESTPSAIDITAALATGQNTITIRAANGTGAFSGCTNCTYQQNPAGVIFCVDVRY